MKKRIRSLDGLRGVAILMVIIEHAQSTLPSGYTGLLYPLRLFTNGYLGVQIFFVLSGYLISSILIREYDTIGRLDIKAFYCRRILRIFPTFYAYLLFVALLNWLGCIHIPWPTFGIAGAHLLNYALAVSLLCKIGPFGTHYWFVGHFWSLSTEEQFYWIWPVILLLVLRTRWYGAVAAIILAMPLMRISSYYLWPALRNQQGHMLHSSADSLMYGCLLALCASRFPGICRKLLMSPWAVTLLPLYLLAIEPLLHQVVPRSFNNTLGLTLAGGMIALFLNNVLLQEKPAWYHLLLESGLLVFLGRISYSLYVWQQLYLTWLNTTYLGKWPFNLIAALVTGYLSYRFIEQPFVRLKDKFFPAHLHRIPLTSN